MTADAASDPAGERRGLSPGTRAVGGAGPGAGGPRCRAGQGRAGPAAIAASPAAAPTMHPDTHTHTEPRHSHTGMHTGTALLGPTRSNTRPRSRTHGPRPPEPTHPRVTSHSQAGLPLPPLLCAPASAAAERPHMSANTSRQKPASAEQRQPGLPSSQHKAASSYFQACSLSLSEGTLLCFSLSLSSLPVQLLHKHTSIIHCLSPGFQAKPITDGVLLMGSCRTCQQAICAQATTL